jgi:general secretion pathway protein F
MARFQYAAYDAAGRIERGEVDSASRADALCALEARGLLPFETSGVAPTNGRRTLISLRRSRRLGLKVCADLTRELAVLLAADIPLDASLRLLVHKTQDRQLGALAERLLAGVNAGQPLSASLADPELEAPPLLVNLLRAGEARGNLAPTLADLAAFFESRMETQGKVRSALVYPAVLCVTALGAISIIITVLVPALLPLFADSGASPPLILRLGHALGQGVGTYGYLWAAGLIAATLGLRGFLRRPAVRRRLDEVALRLPGIRSLIMRASTALFARTLGTLLRNGVSLLPALSIAASVVPNGAIAAAIRRAAEHVKEGRRLADALAETGRFSDFALRFVAIGEEASRLDRMLLHLAELSDKEAQRSIDRAMTLISPLLTIMIGGLIGSLFVSVVQALLSVNQLALQ